MNAKVNLVAISGAAAAAVVVLLVLRLYSYTDLTLGEKEKAIEEFVRIQAPHFQRICERIQRGGKGAILGIEEGEVWYKTKIDDNTSESGRFKVDTMSSTDLRRLRQALCRLEGETFMLPSYPGLTFAFCPEARVFPEFGLRRPMPNDCACVIKPEAAENSAR